MKFHFLAQTAEGSGAPENGLGIIVGFVGTVLFTCGALVIIGGVAKVREGDATGKKDIVAGILLLVAIAIMVAFYASFEFSSSAATSDPF